MKPAPLSDGMIWTRSTSVMARSMASLTWRSRLRSPFGPWRTPLCISVETSPNSIISPSRPFTNDELIAVDQSGLPAVQVTGGPQPVWMSKQADGSIYVAIYNLNGLSSKITVPWSDLGFRHALAVRDVWTHINLGPSSAAFTTTLAATAHVC